MKKCSLVAAIALVLSGCGGESKDIGTSVESAAFNVTAIDGYLKKAKIFVGESCAEEVGETADGGILAVPVLHKGKAFCVDAIPGITVDEERGLVTAPFRLRAPAGMMVVTPFTEYLVETILTVKEETGEELSLEEAKAQVLETFVAQGLEISMDELFGDFIKVKHERLMIIGEILVDYKIKKQTIHIDELKQLIVVVRDAKDLTGFYPVLVNGAFEVNYRPFLIDGFKEQYKDKIEIDLDNNPAIEDINFAEMFDDIDGDALTLEVKVHGGDSLEDFGLSFDEATGILSGSFVQAGKLKFEVRAFDEKGARSRPLDVEFDVKTNNQAPEVDQAVRDEVQKQFDALDYAAGEEILEYIDLEGLFTDSDDTDLSFTAQRDVRLLNLEPTAAELTMKGTAIYGKHEIVISAKDSVNKAVEANFKFEVQEADQNTAPIIAEGAIASAQEALELTVAELVVDGALVMGETIEGEVVLGDFYQYIFVDVDADTLSFELAADVDNSAVLDFLDLNPQGELVLKETPVAGSYLFTITATDSEGNISDAVQLTLTLGDAVDSEPTITPDVAHYTLQSTLDQLSLAAGDLSTPVVVEFDLSTLFDAEVTAITAVQTDAVAGDLTVSINETTGYLEFSGTTLTAGEHSFSITAIDAEGTELTASASLTATVYDAALVDVAVKATVQDALDALALTFEAPVAEGTVVDLTGLFIDTTATLSVSPEPLSSSLVVAIDVTTDPAAPKLTISGTPNIAGSETFTVTATAADGSATEVKLVNNIADAETPAQ